MIIKKGPTNWWYLATVIMVAVATGVWLEIFISEDFPEETGGTVKRSSLNKESLFPNPNEGALTVFDIIKNNG